MLGWLLNQSRIFVCIDAADEPLAHSLPSHLEVPAVGNADEKVNCNPNSY